MTGNGTDKSVRYRKNQQNNAQTCAACHAGSAYSGALYIVDSFFVGRVGFRFVGISFLPMVTSLIFPVFFQAVGASVKSSALTVIRTVVLFVPLGYIFSRFGLNWFWLTFPVTETLTSIAGAVLYRRFIRKARAGKYLIC